MNDKVEEIYTQMFAPNPIPQSVIDLYERFVFLGNRIDVPNVNLGALVIIAALATKSAKSSVSDPIEPEEVDMAETLPAQADVGIETGVEPTVAVTPVQTQAPYKRHDVAHHDEHGPLGPMDAPIPTPPPVRTDQPTTTEQPQKPAPIRGMSVKEC